MKLRNDRQSVLRRIKWGFVVLQRIFIAALQCLILGALILAGPILDFFLRG
jgi:hypothetical protein